jgi:acyl carrier protein
MTYSREQVRATLIDLLRNAREDWDGSIAVSDDTGLFNDLGFESIDAVGLSSAVESAFNKTLPFPEFMAQAKREEWTDITVGRLLNFICTHVGVAESATA